jgi:hypothetical protein
MKCSNQGWICLVTALAPDGSWHTASETSIRSLTSLFFLPLVFIVVLESCEVSPTFYAMLMFMGAECSNSIVII